VEDLTSSITLANIKLQTSLLKQRELSVANILTILGVVLPPKKSPKSPKKTRLLLLSLRWKLICQLWMEKFTLPMMKSLRSRQIETSIVASLLHSISNLAVEESRHICHRRRQRLGLLRDTWKGRVSDKHLFRAVTLSNELMSETRRELVESLATVETTIKSNNIAIQAQHSNQGDSTCLRKMSKAQSRSLAAPNTPT